jgi:hypothetical protein
LEELELSREAFTAMGIVSVNNYSANIFDYGPKRNRIILKELQYDGASVLDMVKAYCGKLNVSLNTFERACDVLINFHEDLVPKDESAKVVLMEQVNFVKANWEEYCVFVKAKIIPGELEPKDPPKTYLMSIRAMFNPYR